MAARREYTRKDNVGAEVRKGDRVTVVFEGVVRIIEPNGRMVIKTDQGFFTQYDPDYQGLVKHQPTMRSFNKDNK